MGPLVRSYLNERSARYESFEHAPLVSFEDAQAILPHDPAKMVKGLAFAMPGDLPAIVAMRGGARADYKKIADALQVRRADLRMADARFLEEHLGMEVGGIVPLPINGTKILVDRDVATLDEIICGSGRNSCTLIFAAAEFLRLCEGVVGDYAKV